VEGGPVSGAYYNEIDPRAAAWLRELINQGQIAPGDVDERDMRDVTPAELARYTQCHFFAGIGVWSYALRSAGWPDDRPVWTGSCPCQPFSQAGAKAGFDDERHLWPAWQWLIDQRRPVSLFGEQVANRNVDPWIDLVQADLEGMDYAFGCTPLPAAGFGAPNIRDRAFWMAHAKSGGFGELGNALGARRGRHTDGSVVTGGLANAAGGGSAAGATLYLEGHTYACDPCKLACQRAGIAEIVIGSPPDLAA
jgi:DNA (cytosine-5)-methyltransferase 1